MSKVSVFDHGWIDMVFEGRNQNYGAYQLRKQDARTTLLALITGVALLAILVSIPVAINYFRNESTVVTDTPSLPDTILIHNEKITPPEPIIEPAQPAAPSGPAQTAPTTAYTGYTAATTPTPADLPTIDEVINTQPGTVTQPGDGTVPFNIGEPGTGGTGTGTGHVDGTGTAPIVAALLDIAPEYPGGLAKFYKEVANKFNAPEVGISRELKVYVTFVVEKDGSMSNIKVLQDPGYGMGAEAIRVLQSLKKKWKPGIKDGKPVRTAYNLPIKVNVH